MPGKHAKLAPSGASRWLKCTGSVALSEGLEETRSNEASEGTLAHKIAELKALKRFTPMPPSEYKKRLEELQDDPMFDREMDRSTTAYVEYIEELMLSYPTKPFIAFETTVDASEFVPECWGTCDCALAFDDTLHVIDFKYGAGVAVSAEANPQMMLYGLGWISRLDMLFTFSRVVMHIFQPRIGEPSSWEMKAFSLKAWGHSLREIGNKALKGEGTLEMGEHCQFCPAAAVCRLKQEKVLPAVEAMESGPVSAGKLSNDEIGDILARLDGIDRYHNALKAHALQELKAGRGVKGYKLVQGNGKRAFIDHAAAVQEVEISGLMRHDELWTETPLSLTALEKELGAATFKELLADHITKSGGGPALAKETDKRPPLNTASEDFGA